MGLFDVESPETKVQNRTSAVKELATQLKAEYYYGIELIKNKFDLSDNNSDLNCSNTIVGEIQGFEYCFIEYYHIGRGKNNHSRWITQVYLRLNKEDVPDFQLLTKKSALAGAGCGVLFGLPFFSVPFFLLYQAIKTILPLIGKGSDQLLSYVGMFLFYLIFGLIFGAVGGFIIFYSLKSIKEIYGQKKYNIFNSKFNNKYVIFSEADVNSVRKLFTNNVTEKIVNFKPEITNINCHNKCLSSSFDYNEQLSYDSCNKFLAPLLKQAQIFEEEPDFLN